MTRTGDETFLESSEEAIIFSLLCFILLTLVHDLRLKAKTQFAVLEARGNTSKKAFFNHEDWKNFKKVKASFLNGHKLLSILNNLENTNYSLSSTNQEVFFICVFLTCVSKLLTLFVIKCKKLIYV